MFDFYDIKKFSIPDTTGKYHDICAIINPTDSKVLWKYKLYCEVFSRLSINHETLTSYYGGNISDNIILQYPSSDISDEKFIFLSSWYYYDKDGTKKPLNNREFSNFKYEDLSIYPSYSELATVNVYTVTDDKVEQISSKLVYVGDEFKVTHPEISSYTYYYSIPHEDTWNPISGDTNISLIYESNTYEVKLSVDGDKGITYGAGTYSYGTYATISVFPNDISDVFRRWNDDNTDNPRTIYVDSDKSLTAYVGSSILMRYHMNIPITITYYKGY